MGDVNIVIKDGHIVSVDGEDEDDSDLDAISGSGENAVEPNATDVPYHYTPTANNTFQKVSSPDDNNLLPYIIAGVVGFVVLILVIVIIVWCRRRKMRRKSPYKQPNPGPVVYSPNGLEGAVGGEGYSVAIPLTAGEPPLEEAPPPPVPASAPPKTPGLSASGGSTSTPRYTPLGGRKDVTLIPLPEDYDKNSIYESIDDDKVANVYEEAVPAVPKSNSGRRTRPLSSLGEDDPNMGSEKDKMLPSTSPV